ncbi:MAG: chemotaxis protein CheB [Pseudomonadaceae bacterium]
MTEPAPGIALLACDAGQRQQLAEVLSTFGYRIVSAEDPSLLQPEQLTQIQTDAWLLELAEESLLTEWLLEHSEVPVLLGAGEIPAADSEDYPRWQCRLYAKLQPLLGAPAQGQAPSLITATLATPTERGPCVWVLGASLGGPTAVKRFLDVLPASLPIAFVYAQHIDPGFEQQLPQIIGRQNEWQVLNCRPGSRLQAGEVLVVPIAQRLGFNRDGELTLSDEPWPGPYQPSIETVLDTVCQQFGPACGAIIFSGMGEDGVAACGRMRQQGIEVWTQDTQSAACATMPGAVLEAGFSHRQGSPEELAAALQRWLAQEWSAAS